jgi:hypothetical protein
MYWVRNKKGQIAAEVSEKGFSVHDQGLSWKLQRLKEEGAPPFSTTDHAGDRDWVQDALLRFLEEDGYTLERQETGSATSPA